MSVEESAPAVHSKPLPAAPNLLLPILNGVMHSPAGETETKVDVTPPQAVPSTRLRAAWYGGALTLTIVVLFLGMRLDALSLSVPFCYEGDALLIMPMVKSTLERGSHWRNQRMGFPGVQELHDFPVIDHLHFAFIWVLGLILRDWAVVYNAYYLLTYPLTTLTAMYAFRRLGLSLPIAAVGGLLYAFMPYHYMRGESHYFLAAYWLIPLTWLPALAVCRGELPFFTRTDGRDRWSLGQRANLWQVVLAAGTASAGAYYAFFACAIYAFVGIYQWVMTWNWKPAASAGILCALISLFGIVNHLPAIAHAMKYGRNPVTERLPGEAEFYGLKFAQLILPIDAHNFTEFGRLKSRYNSFERPLQNENTSASLGIVASLGLLGMIVALIFSKNRNAWPYGPLMAVTGFIFLYGTVGGLSSLFNLLVFDQIRCPNRISIYLAFICLFAALYPLDRFLASRTVWRHRLRYPAIVTLAAFGIADQTPTPWFTDKVLDYPSFQAKRFRADRRFFQRVEESMPEGARIFNCPYIPYPEVGRLVDMDTYEHARGYLHTNTLVWSYGSMKNREVDVWQDNVSHDHISQICRRIVAAGFDGLVIDKRGFEPSREIPNMGDHIVNQFKIHASGNGKVKPPVIDHEDGTLTFIDLRGYRDWLQAQDPLLFEKWVLEEKEFVAITWINGFMSNEAYGRRDDHRWGYRKGTAVIVNPTDRVRLFRFRTTFGVDANGEFTLRIDAPTVRQVNRPGGPGPWVDEFPIETEVIHTVPPQRKLKTWKEYILEIPPGRHVVQFRCTAPYHYLPPDSRPLTYYMSRVEFHEVK